MKKFLALIMVVSFCYFPVHKKVHAENRIKSVICQGILGAGIVAGGTTGFLIGGAATLVIAPIGVPVIILNPKDTWEHKTELIGGILGLPILGIPIGFLLGGLVSAGLCLLIIGDEASLHETLEKINNAQSIQDLQAIGELQSIQS